MWPRAIAIALALAGCRQIFGLSPPDRTTDAADKDSDGDGIVDGADNCPTVANPDQIDTDQNGIGDACEGCTMLPLRNTDDDDGDGFTDLVDACLGVTSNATLDSDGDGIWDSCDPRTGTDVRFCAMTFRDPAAGEDPDIWKTSWDLSNWTVSASAIKHAQTAQNLTACVHSTYAASGGIAFELRGTLAGYTEPTQMGIRAEADSGLVYACRISQPIGGGTASLELVRGDSVVKTLPLPIALPMTASAVYHFAFDIDGPIVTETCTVDNLMLGAAFTVKTSETTTLPPLRPGVFADSATLAVFDFVIYKLGN